jgi:hypothetical protein
MRMITTAVLLATTIAGLSHAKAQVSAKKSSIPAVQQSLTYADAADLALAAQQVSAIRIRQAARLKGQEALTVIPGRRRFLVTAEVLALIRSKEPIPPRISFIVDLAAGADGKFPKLNKGEWILFSNPVSGFPMEVRLVSPDALIPALPDQLARVRTILKDANAESAPPAITGIASAFHSRGSIEGEGESQIFLDAVGGKPVSLSVARQTGAAPIWSVALGDVVDQGAGPPAKDSFLWYRLACFLPASLPASSLAETSPDDAPLAEADYRFILQQLGACKRTLNIRPGG